MTDCGIRISSCFQVLGILILGSTLSMTCRNHNPSPNSFSVAFGRTGNDWANSVQQTSDGGYIITGSIGSDTSDRYGLWLIKTDASGNKVWDKTFGGQRYDEGYSVQQTTDGGYIIAGRNSYDYYTARHRVWLIKTDSAGRRVWDKTFSRTHYDAGYSVRQTFDGGYVIAGVTNLYGAGGSNVWLITTDASGNKVWDRTFGGTGDDEGHSVLQTTDSGYVVVGWTTWYGAGGRDIWLIRTDESGSEIWDGTSGGPDDDEGYSVEQTTAGGYIVAGMTWSFGAGNRDVWLVKTDSGGNRAWSRTFGGTYVDEGCSAQQTSDGGYVIAGWTIPNGERHSDLLLIKTDADGKKVWDRTIGGTGDVKGYSVRQTADGGYIVAGSTQRQGGWDSDVLLVKTDADGN